MKTVAILLKSGKVSKVSFNTFTCYQLGKESSDNKKETIVKLKKVFQSNEDTQITEINNIIGFSMLTNNTYIKFESQNSSFVVNSNDISGVEITE